MQFQLEPGDPLMLMSDGIAEAKNERGQLFGFHRITDMRVRASPRSKAPSPLRKWRQPRKTSARKMTFWCCLWSGNATKVAVAVNSYFFPGAFNPKNCMASCRSFHASLFWADRATGKRGDT